jgi:acyl carrier protein
MNDSFEILKNVIRSIQQQQGYQQVDIRPEFHLVHDFGFTSLDIAQLIAMMEGELGIDPFSNGATLDQISTAGDMARLYV